MKKGTLVLYTEGGERKMSYSEVDNIYYMSTKSHTNKVSQIKKNNEVKIDLDNNKYKAKLISISDVDYDKTGNIYLSTMSKFQTFIYKNLFGKKNDMFIVLEKKL